MNLLRRQGYFILCLNSKKRDKCNGIHYLNHKEKAPLISKDNLFSQFRLVMGKLNL